MILTSVCRQVSLRVIFGLHSARIATLRWVGVIIGDVPSYRADQMPYGGMKDSGIGREGVRSAMDDFTVEKVLVLAGGRAVKSVALCPLDSY